MALTEIYNQMVDALADVAGDIVKAEQGNGLAIARARKVMQAVKKDAQELRIQAMVINKATKAAKAEAKAAKQD